jgi:pyruvate kinase
LTAPVSDSVDGLLDNSVKAAEETGLVNKGDIVVITGGVLVNVAGTTNMIKVHEV